MSSSMFPFVEKTYRVKITEDIERDLRLLGQSRVDALTSKIDMTLIKDKGALTLYELCEKDLYTMKGVAKVTAPITEVMHLLKMDSTSKMRDLMGEIFGMLFLEGLCLYRGRDVPSHPHESMSINWMALQASKPHLPHRDYLFLRYGDLFEKPSNASTGSTTTGGNSGLCIGASIWESIDLNGCAPLPGNLNVVRLRLRRCGIVVEELDREDNLQISLYLSEAHPGRASVSSLTKQWMTKMVSCVAEIANVVIAQALSSQNILTKTEFTKDGANCYLCVKPFSMFRRKHHCRVCGDVVCSKCSEMRTVKQGPTNKEIRVCSHCVAGSSVSMRSSGSGNAKPSQSNSVSNSVWSSNSQQQYNYPPSVGTYSISSSEQSNSIYDDDEVRSIGSSIHGMSMGYSNAQKGSITTENRLNNAAAGGGGGSTFSSSLTSEHRLKTHPSARPQGGQATAAPKNDMILLSEVSIDGNAANKNDMIYLGGGAGSTSTSTSSNGDHSMPARQNSKKDRASSSPPLNSSEFELYTASTLPENPIMATMAPIPPSSGQPPATLRENTPYTYALSYSSRQDWPKAPMPPNESARLKKVRELYLVDPGNRFQEMCEFAAAELGCQIAAICFIGDKSGFLMAKVGLEKRELPRNILLDAHTIMAETPTIVLDASEDLRFVKNPLVQEGKVRFYAGFPLITREGHIVGSFSVADPFAREIFTGDKYQFLQNLATVAMREVEENTLNKNNDVNFDVALARSGSQGSPPRHGGGGARAQNMNMADAAMTMQELLKTAYSTQYQMRMQVSPTQ